MLQRPPQRKPTESDKGADRALTRRVERSPSGPQADQETQERLQRLAAELERSSRNLEALIYQLALAIELVRGEVERGSRDKRRVGAELARAERGTVGGGFAGLGEQPLGADERRPARRTPRAASSAARGRGLQPAARLGAREREVLKLITEGLRSPRIAARLGIKTATVEVHRRNIMRKLDLHSVAALTKYAVREGLTEL